MASPDMALPEAQPDIKNAAINKPVTVFIVGPDECVARGNGTIIEDKERAVRAVSA
jgi:hypothetical protein